MGETLSPMGCFRQRLGVFTVGIFIPDLLKEENTVDGSCWNGIVSAYFVNHKKVTYDKRICFNFG